MGRRGTSTSEAGKKRADGSSLPVSGLALALEPRFMYDAAGGATAAAVAKQADPVPVSHDNDQSGHEAAAGNDAVNSGADGHVPIDVGPFGSKGEAQLAEAGMAPKPLTEIVFVDARLPDQNLMHPQDGVEFVVLDPSRDGIAQISQALAGRSDISAIHIFSHGDRGTFTLGATKVDSQTLMQKAADFAGWSSSLTRDADILIWGCDVASLPGGQALLNSLSSLTGADVAASDDATGAVQKGGDWDLEAKTGSIESDLPFEATALADWTHLLGAPDVTGTGVIRVAEPSSLNAPGASTITLGGAGYGLSYDAADASDQVSLIVKVGDTAIGTLSQTGGATAIAGGWRFEGTLAEANAWLKALTFNAADVERGNVTGATSITVDITNITDGATAAQKSISVEVTPSNDPVTLNDVTLSVPEVGSGGGNSVTVIGADILNSSDSEVEIGTQNSSQIIYRLDGSLPQYGYLTLNGQRIGAGSIFTQQDVIDGKLAYVHTATGSSQNLQDSFSVHINDGATPISLSDSATIRLNITPVNQAPIVSGGGSIYEGQPANAADGKSQVGQFIVADSGGDPTDPLTVELTSLPQHGTLFFTGEVMIGGVARTVTNYQITAADISNGFVFAYAARGGLTYANNGIDNPVTRRPPSDSFGVTVRDSGGGAGTSAALSASATIDLNILPVNDNPVWDEGSTQQATVPAPTGDPGTDYKVTLDQTMLNVTDIDSLDTSITFVVMNQSGMDQGRLYVIENGTPRLIPVGGTFTLADIKAGRIQYWQHLGAGPGNIDTFNFRVLDNAQTLNWRPDGTTFERIGGVYTNATESGTLRDFTFTINLRETSEGVGGGLPPLPNATPGTADQTHAGTNTSGQTYGSLIEGGSVRIYGSSDGSSRPYLNYTVDGVKPDQVVYTIIGFNGAGSEWNGQLQKYIGGEINDDASWIALGLYETFTQADLDAGSIRFVHDGGEDFDSSVVLSASGGVLVPDGSGGLAVDQTQIEFFFYARPVNDAPVAAGSSQNVILEGATTAITRDMLQFSDTDDTVSEAHLESGATLPGTTDPNFALNHDGANPLTFKISDLPDNGKLFYFDGSQWVEVTTATVLHADWITGDPATTRLHYIHAGGENLVDSFQVQATDRWNANSGTVSVNFVVTPINDAPQIAQDPTEADPAGPHPSPDAGSGGRNEPLQVVYEGSWSQITPDMLQAVDPDSTSSQVQYRITTAPAHGRVAYSTDGVTFATLGVGSSFTQADVTAGRIYYLHNGDEPNGSSYNGPADPGTPDDTFTFTLSDGVAEQTGREFWIYVKPANDAPVVTAPSGPIRSTDTQTSIPGFSIADPDLAGTISGSETNFIQAVVRLLDSNGIPLPQASYTGVTISVDAAGGVTIDGDSDGAGSDVAYDGVNGVLILRGTIEQVNAALATLRVSFATDRDAVYRVEVIADDRLRDPNGALIDADAATPGVQPDANGGGMRNEPETPMTGVAKPILATEYDPYADRIPTTGDIVGNLTSASVTIYASRENDPATLGSTNPNADVYEDQATNIGSQIKFDISDTESDTFRTPVKVTLTVPSGTLNVGTPPAGISVTGTNTGTLVVTGVASDIEAFLNSSLTYKSANNTNHDLNDAAAGDVTLTVSFSDVVSPGNDSAIGQDGSPGAPPNPPDLSIALTIIPVNDAPSVSADSSDLALNGTTPVPGFSVGDIDISGDGGPAGPATGEQDFIQVTVRVTNSTGTPLAQEFYNGTNGLITIGFGGDQTQLDALIAAGFDIDDAHSGNNSALVIRGTQAQVNAYLAGLTVSLSGALANSDQTYRVQVVADDRARIPGTWALDTQANGGGNANGNSGTINVPSTEVSPYAATPGGLAANVASASRAIFPSSVNDPAEIRGTPAPVSEGSPTVPLTGIVISDPDALATDQVTVTVTLESGFTIAQVRGSSSDPAVGTGSVTFHGTLAEINAWVASIWVQLPDTPGAPTSSDWNGTFDVTIKVNDEGNNGGRPVSLPDLSPGDPAYAGEHGYEDPTASDPDTSDDNHLITTRTFTFTVNPVNDAPVVSGTVTNPTLVENNSTNGSTSVPPVKLLTDVTVSDIDLDTTPALASDVFGSGVLSVELDVYRPGDHLFVDAPLPTGVTVLSDGAAGVLRIQFDANTTVAEIQSVLAALSYRNDSDNPTNFGQNTTRTYTITLNDGNNVQPDGDHAGGPAGLDAVPLTGIITITATNDPPVAVDDTHAIAEHTTSVSSNVITGRAGTGIDGDSDNMISDLRVTGVRVGQESAGSVPSGNLSGSGIAGSYGTLVLQPDGSYTYTLDNNNAAVNALRAGQTLTEYYTYAISDGAGGTDIAQITITINGVTDGAPSITPVDGNGGTTAGEAEVYEKGLGDLSDASETTTGAISVTAPDGLSSITVGGTTITLAQLNNLATTPIAIDTGEGILVLTGFVPGVTVGGVPVDGDIAYTYTLKSGQPHPGATESTDQIALAVQDAGGGTNTGTLTVRIIDDVPSAVNDTNSIAEDGAPSVSGTLVGNDRIGADATALPVTGISFGGTAQSVGTSFATTYGSIVVDADGSYTYTLDNGNPVVNALLAGQTLTEVVEYTITDADGDTSTATLTVTINGTIDGAPTITPDDGNGAATGQAEVYEKGLGDPSNQSEITTGSIAVKTLDGLSSVTIGGTVVTLTQLAALETTPISIDTGEGTLVITAFTVTGTVGGVPTTGALSYTYTLEAAQSHPGASESIDTIALVVTDAAGVSSTGTLTVRIIDDVPSAVNDTNSIAEDGAPSVSGTLVGNDRIGADATALPVTGISFGGTAQSVGTSFATTYGSIVVDADGSYTYTLDSSSEAVNRLRVGQSLTEVVEYTITDADGDTSTATLTITIKGSNDGPVVVPGADLPDRTNKDSDTVPSVDVKGVFADLDIGDTLTYTATGLPPGLTLDPVTGLITGTLHPSASKGGAEHNGLYVVTVTAKDATGAAVSISFNWNVSNPPPVAVNDANRTDRNTPVTGNVMIGSGRDSDPDGDSIRVTEAGERPVTSRGITVSGSDGGRFTIHPDGSYTFDPGRDFLHLGAAETASTSITYTITDADGATATAILIVTVHGVADAPVVTDLPGYDRWGFMSETPERDWGMREEEYGYLEGRPVDRYTSTWRTVSQQVVFRQWGSVPTTLFFEARLGRNQILPSWISFDASTQTVTANPTDQTEPGIYVVRVTAKDTSGREAEAEVTIHLLRDNAKSLETIKFNEARPDPQGPAEPAPQGTAPAADPEPAPAPTDAAPEAEPAGDETPARLDVEQHSALPVFGQSGSHIIQPQHANGQWLHAEVQGASRSLTQTLFQHGSTGQMIAAASFLEALAADTQTRR